MGAGPTVSTFQFFFCAICNTLRDHSRVILSDGFDNLQKYSDVITLDNCCTKTLTLFQMLFNLNMTKQDSLRDKLNTTKGLKEIDLIRWAYAYFPMSSPRFKSTKYPISLFARALCNVHFFHWSALEAAQGMLSQGLVGNSERASTRGVINFITDSSLWEQIVYPKTG